MGRAPCCEKLGLRRGRWTEEEDEILRNYIQAHGEGSWRSLPKNAGLLRCGKSCRLRWINYLRSDLKRGNISAAEEQIIINLHASLGNRWSVIAGRLPGRTDNEIKNYWNSHLSRQYHSIVRKPDPKFTALLPAPTQKPTRRPGKKKKKKNKNINSSSNKPSEEDKENKKDASSSVIPMPKTPTLETNNVGGGNVVISQETDIPIINNNNNHNNNNHNNGMGIEYGMLWMDDIMDDLNGIWPALDEKREIESRESDSGERGYSGGSGKTVNVEELISGNSWRWELDDVMDANERWGQEEEEENTNSTITDNNAMISWLLS